MKEKRNQGFTLFELLVSISIIAILTAVAVVSFGGINKKTRDSRRSADLEKIRISLEGYRQINGTYPTELTALVGSSFLEVLPTDPKDKTSYYAVFSDYAYVLGSKMEDLGSTNYASFETCGSGSCNYRVINP